MFSESSPDSLISPGAISRFPPHAGRVPLRSAGRLRRDARNGARMPVPDGCDGNLDQRWRVFIPEKLGKWNVNGGLNGNIGETLIFELMEVLFK